MTHKLFINLTIEATHTPSSETSPTRLISQGLELPSTTGTRLATSYQPVHPSFKSKPVRESRGSLLRRCATAYLSSGRKSNRPTEHRQVFMATRSHRFDSNTRQLLLRIHKREATSFSPLLPVHPVGAPWLSVIDYFARRALRRKYHTRFSRKRFRRYRRVSLKTKRIRIRLRMRRSRFQRPLRYRMRYQKTFTTAECRRATQLVRILRTRRLSSAKLARALKRTRLRRN